MKKTLALFLAMILAFGLQMPLGSAFAEDAEPVELKLMAKVVNNEIDMQRSNMVEFQKRTNTKLSFEIPPYSNYAERVRMVMAAGIDLPDAVQDVPKDMLADLYEMGIILSLEEYVENAENLKAIYERFPGYLDAYTIDGHLVALPTMGYNRGLGGSYVRLDWIKNLGLEELIDVENCKMTLEDFETLLMALTFDDPDGNGVNDTYGFGMPAGSNYTTYVPNIIQGAFGSGNVFKRAEDGHYYNALLEDQWENYLAAAAYFKKLINLGVVDPEAFTLTREQFRERWYSGKVASAFTFGSSGSIASFSAPMKEIDPNVELTWLQSLVGENGQYKTYLNGLANLSNMWVVTANCEDPQAFVDMLDFVATQEGELLLNPGLENEHYTMVDGQPDFTTQEQKDAYNAWRNASPTFLSFESFSDRVQVVQLQFDTDVRNKILSFRACEASSYVFTDNLGLIVPTYDRIDRYEEYNDSLSNAVLKYLTTPEQDTSEMQAVRDDFIASREYKEYWELVTSVYQEAGH